MTIRELTITGVGVRVGQPLRQFQGVLSGEPRYVGETPPLLGGGSGNGNGKEGA